MTGMDGWLEGWTSPNEVGGQEFEQRVAFLKKEKGSPGLIQPGSARLASCTRRISSTYRGKLAVETRRRADCKYLLQGSFGTDPRRSKQFYKCLPTGIPRDDANPEHSLSRP